MARRASVTGGTVVVCLTMTLAGCGDSGLGSTVPSVVTLSLASSVLAVGGTTQATALVRNAEGETITGEPVEFSSDDTDVATVDQDGVVSAVSPGNVRIEATAGDVTGGALLRVHAQTCTAAASEGEIDPGGAVSGDLAVTDCLFFGDPGPHADGFTLSLVADAVIDVSLTSAAFDAVVALTDTDFELLTFNDDAMAGSTDSRLVVFLEAGEYILWASSFGTGETGSYTLSIGELDIELCDEPVGAIAIGEEIDDALDEASCFSQVAGDRITDPWTFEADEEVEVQIDLTSDDFDAFLAVADADGEIVALDDDGGDDLDARVVATLPAGTYTIFAASFAVGEVGSYTLAVADAAGGGGRGAAPIRRPGAKSGHRGGWWVHR